MKLYFSKGACSLTIRIVAHELGIKLDYEAVSLKDKKTGTGQDYWMINPKGSVPALQIDNDTILTENIAILEYLADNHPSKMLPPIGKFERYRVLEWLSFMATDMHKAYSPIMNPRIPKELKETVFYDAIKAKLAFVDKALKGHTYLTGDDFTLPDAYFFVILRWLPRLEIHLDPYPEVQRFFNTIAERQAVKEALNEEGAIA